MSLLTPGEDTPGGKQKSWWSTHTRRKPAIDEVYEQQFRRSREGAKSGGEEKNTVEESSWGSLVRPALIPPLRMVFCHS